MKIHVDMCTEMEKIQDLYPEKTRTREDTDSNVHCSTMYNSQDMETTCPSTDVVIYTKEDDSAIKRKERTALA